MEDINKNNLPIIESENIYKSVPELISGNKSLYNAIFSDLLNKNDDYINLKNYDFESTSKINDYYFNSKVNNLNECVNECDKLEECKGYSFNESAKKNKCTLYDGIPKSLKKKNFRISGYKIDKEFSAQNLKEDQIYNIQNKIGAEYLNKENFINNSHTIENFIGNNLSDCVIADKNLRKIKINVEVEFNTSQTKSTDGDGDDIYKLCLRNNTSTIQCFEKNINNVPIRNISNIKGKKNYLLNLELSGSKINNIQLYLGNNKKYINNIHLYFILGRNKFKFAEASIGKYGSNKIETFYFDDEIDFTNLKINYKGNIEYVNLLNDTTLNKIKNYSINSSCDISKFPDVNIKNTYEQNFNEPILNNKKEEGIKYSKDINNQLFNNNIYKEKINVLQNKKLNDNFKNIINNSLSLNNEKFKNRCNNSYFNGLFTLLIIFLIFGIIVFYNNY